MHFYFFTPLERMGLMHFAARTVDPAMADAADAIAREWLMRCAF